MFGYSPPYIDEEDIIEFNKGMNTGTDNPSWEGQGNFQVTQGDRD